MNQEGVIFSLGGWRIFSSTWLEKVPVRTKRQRWIRAGQIFFLFFLFGYLKGQSQEIARENVLSEQVVGAPTLEENHYTHCLLSLVFFLKLICPQMNHDSSTLVPHVLLTIFYHKYLATSHMHLTKLSNHNLSWNKFYFFIFVKNVLVFLLCGW